MEMKDELIKLSDAAVQISGKWELLRREDDHKMVAAYRKYLPYLPSFSEFIVDLLNFRDEVLGK